MIIKNIAITTQAANSMAKPKNILRIVSSILLYVNLL